MEFHISLRLHDGSEIAAMIISLWDVVEGGCDVVLT
jgi:hypothetical protein